MKPIIQYTYLFCYLKVALLLVFLTINSNLAAAPEMRIWTSTAGTTLEAALIKVDGSNVVLLGSDGVERMLPIRLLSVADQSHIEEKSRPRGEPRIASIDAEAGRISGPVKCTHDAKWSYYIYLPKSFHDAQQWPVWYVFSPGGGQGGNALQRYIEGAELINAIVVLSVESKNSFPDGDLAVQAMVRDVNTHVPIIPGLAFSSGFSGGGRMAYWLAEADRNIAGVLACGTNHGIYPARENVVFRNAKLRSSTYVYSLIGTNCFNRTGAFQSHKSFSRAFRLRFFPGGHVWAFSNLIAEGMARVFGAGLQSLNHSDADRLRRAYSLTMWEFTQKKIETEPWEAHYWADFLKDFKTDSGVQEQALRLERELRTNPLVDLTKKAERDLLRFGDSHFQIFYTEDRKENPNRSRDAQRLSDTYSEIPYGELFRLLGDKS
jgi:hypothetical protein